MDALDLPSTTTPVVLPAPTPAPKLLSALGFFRANYSNPITAFAEPFFVEPFVSMKLGRYGPSAHHIVDPALIKRVFVDAVDIYEKGTLVRRRLKPMVGDSVLVAETRTWLPQRRIIQPLFRPKATGDAFPMMRAAADVALGALAEIGPGGTVDVGEMTGAYAFDVIARAAFSGDRMADRAAFAKALADYVRTLGKVDLASFLGLPEWVPTVERLRSRPARQRLHGEVSALISRRRAAIAAAGETGVPDDLLTRLLVEPDPKTGERLSADHVHDNVMTFFTAGYETTANTLTWTLLALSQSPGWRERVLDEVLREIGPEGPQGPADLDRLVLTRMVVEETLRLYPPVPVIPRVPNRDDRLGEIAVKKGDFVFTIPWVSHRHRARWEAPGEFRPERFRPDRREAIQRNVYFPFGIGPRACLGATFAWGEILTFLATVLPRFSFEVVDAAAVEPLAAITLRPKNPMIAKLHPRG